MFGGAAMNGSPTYAGGGARGVDGNDAGGAPDAGLGETSHVYTATDGRTVEIREVWADNLDEEMALVREIVERYPCVAMDTEFPGVVARPIGDFMAQDYQYKTLKCNVDLLKIIQLGLSFTDENGQCPEPCHTWQFNFSFSLRDDIFADDSIELLKKSGLDFQKHERHGISPFRFGELMMTSGLVLLDNVRWISFHSGYDFAYLVKVLTCQALPGDEGQFFDVLRTYFPCFYDIKYLVTACQGMHGGLQKLADELQVERVGPMHQAGSDALLTAHTFFKLVEKAFQGLVGLDEANKFKGELFGLGHNHTAVRNYNANVKAREMNGATRLERQASEVRDATPQPSRPDGPQAVGMGVVGSPGLTSASTAAGEDSALAFLLPEQYSAGGPGAGGGGGM